MRIGIDLGGTKIEGIALDEKGRGLLRRRLPTPQGDYRATVDAVAALVAAIEKETTYRGTAHRQHDLVHAGGNHRPAY